MTTAANDPKVEAALTKLLAAQKTLKLATAGGPNTPWITGTYFAEGDAYTLYLTLEPRGKGFANIGNNPKVAVAIDTSNAFDIFAQGTGTARLIEGPDADRHLAALKRKIPEAEPLWRGELRVMAIDMSEWLVTSFPEGWFPAKTLVPQR